MRDKDSKSIYSIYENLIIEADTLGRAYRMAKNAKSSPMNRKGFTAKEFYNYIKTAQDKAKNDLKNSSESKPITIFHMVNMDRLNNDKTKTLNAIKYLFSKQDEEISVSMDTQVWDIQNSVIFIGTASDIFEHYPSDTYTIASKERYPQDIRSEGDLPWDEATVNLKEVKWESFFNNTRGVQSVDILNAVPDGYDISQIYSYEELSRNYTSDRALEQMDIDDEYKKLSSELYYKLTALNKFLDFLDGSHPNADIIRNSESFSNILGQIEPVDEYTLTELSQWVDDGSEDYHNEKAIPRNELGNRVTRNDIQDTQNEIDKISKLQEDINLAWDDLINELNSNGETESANKIQKSNALKSVTSA